MVSDNPERDQERVNLIRFLEPALGPDATNALMSYIPPFTWDNLVTKDDLAHTEERLRSEMRQLGAELRSEMRQLGAELRSEMRDLGTELRSETRDLRTELSTMGIALRAEIDISGATLRGEIERGFRRQIMWLGTLGTAWVGIVATILGFAI